MSSTATGAVSTGVVSIAAGLGAGSTATTVGGPEGSVAQPANATATNRRLRKREEALNKIRLNIGAVKIDLRSVTFKKTEFGTDPFLLIVSHRIQINYTTVKPEGVHLIFNPTV
jgi:hypothetical protein